MRSRWYWWVLGGAVLLALAVWAWPAVRPVFSGSVRTAADWLARTGAWGPFLVVGLQVVQAVISPLPSWPVTVAAGALYGPVAATGYCLAGGLLGATINFSLARALGHQLVRSKVGERWVAQVGRLGPLHFLVLALFGRLIPIASFDLVAYLAGISRLSLPTFLGVALVGQAPAFWAYAYFGSDLARAQTAGIWSTVLVVVFVGLIAGGRYLWQRLAP